MHISYFSSISTLNYLEPKCCSLIRFWCFIFSGNEHGWSLKRAHYKTGKVCTSIIIGITCGRFVTVSIDKYMKASSWCIARHTTNRPTQERHKGITNSQALTKDESNINIILKRCQVSCSTHMQVYTYLSSVYATLLKGRWTSMTLHNYDRLVFKCWCSGVHDEYREHYNVWTLHM